MISTSATAIDPSIEVRRLDDRVFRVVSRRIALPGVKDGAPPIYLGDRRLLRELYERILSPLHADVGIVAVRMGDRATLAALAVTSLPDDAMAPVVDGMGAFRDQAMAAPPALQALVHGGGTALSLAKDSRQLRFRAERVLHAVGNSPSGAGTVIAITLGGMVSAAQFGLIGVGIGAVGGMIAGIVAAVSTNRRNASTVASFVSQHGFPLEDYDAWLISGRPLFDVELVAPIDRAWLLEQLHRIEAFSGEAHATVRWVEDVTWLEDTVVRIETRPTLIQPASSKIQPFYGGSHVLFQRCVSSVLVPLHGRVGIKVVRMGGYVDRRV